MAKSYLTRLVEKAYYPEIPFFIITIAMAIMLLWGGSFKLTAPGAEGIVPFVTNSPLISWNFKVFGTYTGSYMIGITEMTAGLLLLFGLFYSKAGIVGSLIAMVMFFVTSTFTITTPGTVMPYNGIEYLTPTGLFLYKDLISLGACFYLFNHFGRKAILSENK